MYLHFKCIIGYRERHHNHVATGYQPCSNHGFDPAVSIIRGIPTNL